MKGSARNLLVVAFLLAACSTGAGYCPSALAQPPKVQLGSSDDLRAAYAISPDIAKGKRLAESSCATCHGMDGIATVKDTPHIAGQRPGYLLFVLRAYKSGARANDTMGGVVKFLSDDGLIKAAAYYASLDPPQPAATSGAKPARAKPDPVQASKAAAAGCADCHGEAGISKMPGMPSLVGQDPKYLVSAMQAYKGGKRKSDIMKSMLSTITDEDLNNIALYYALQKPGRSQNPAPGDQAAGKAAAAACAGCHGDQGISRNPATSSLAGQDAQYLVIALKAYKGGLRRDETMKGISASLDDQAMKNLAAFYANQQPQPPKVAKPLSTAEWAQRCDRCHGNNGNSSDPRIPALAAQRVDYLEKALQAYRTGARKSSAMAAMSDLLTDADIEELAAQYARQKARAVVYVTLPCK